MEENSNVSYLMEQNHCTFEGEELSLPNLKFLFLKTIQIGITVIYSIHVFYDEVPRFFKPLPLIQLCSFHSTFFIFTCVVIFSLYTFCIW